VTETPIRTTLPIGNTVEQLHALADIVIERQRQDHRFPEQAPGQPGAEGAVLLSVLVEQVEEVAMVATTEGDMVLRRELIEVAAVCVKWLEALDRKAQRDRMHEAVK